MTRIGTYGANQVYLSRINDIQLRSHEHMVQFNTGMKSQTYAGISRDSHQLINFENEISRVDQYIKGNATAKTRLDGMEISLNAIETTMNDFLDQLDDFYAKETRSQAEVTALQEQAYNSMLSLQSSLASSINGQYIFSGGRVNNEPVAQFANSFDDFQTKWDGFDHPYPTTRSGTLLELNATNAETGNVSFSAAAGTITAASLTTSPNVLSDIPVGARITVADSAGGLNDDKEFTVRGVSVGAGGTVITVSPLVTEGPVAASLKYYTTALPDQQQLNANLTFTPGSDTIQVSNATGFTAGQVFEVSGTASNDGVYEVSSIVAGPPDTITINSTKVTTQAAISTVTLSASSWYNGDNLALEHRVGQDRTIDLGVYASDPTFEKAFRAMAIIAQGQYGTAGGLENNLDRIVAARYLLNDAMNSPAGTSPPYGTELSSDLTSLQAAVGNNQALIATKNTIYTKFKGFLQTRASDLEQSDKTELAVLLKSDETALQAAYQTTSMVRELSLLNFMR
ncbi:hypothetical protein [Magnetospirillum moscoviense]|uniref:Uncharacterized protein n=1 Tax=Magnetospirillum moscoviense TaxID=1437059 RepID=A0A178MRT9_9PROT|nr:hypothetical protein [Magnetospirillum moscoviense]MBF0324014.1 hypothetical protein [Alphaproteobacteria bacterium]OAN50767.1 hypothetical protein A6A05_11645 [Magnetospirillum moscoviense]